MSKSYIEPAGDHVLVIDKEQKQILGGIELPDNVRQLDMVYGIVVAVGPLAQARVNPAETVCYGPYAGKLVALEGVQFRIMREGQIEAWIRQGQPPAPPDPYAKYNGDGFASLTAII